MKLHLVVQRIEISPAVELRLVARLKTGVERWPCGSRIAGNRIAHAAKSTAGNPSPKARTPLIRFSPTMPEA